MIAVLGHGSGVIATGAPSSGGAFLCVTYLSNPPKIIDILTPTEY